jgi:hypothetical protein
MAQRQYAWLQMVDGIHKLCSERHWGGISDRHMVNNTLS